jgi:Cu(I)/Ag(I) efflux system membrane protein CusA/SilA
MGFNRGSGSEVMQQIAAPMLGGLVSSTLPNLTIVPALNYLVRLRPSPRE